MFREVEVNDYDWSKAPFFAKANPGREFLPGDLVKAIFVQEDIIFRHGSVQRTPAGGVMLYNGEHVYGMPEALFAARYVRADAKGEVLCALDLPLQEQERICAERKCAEHLDDVRQRIEFEEKRERPFPAPSSEGMSR